MTQLPQTAARALFAFGLICALLVLATPCEAQAEWWQKFKQAREILDGGGDAATAENLLRAAIADKAEPSSNILRRYTPYYYLGMALEEQGDCRGAIASFDQAERFGALKDDQQTDLARRRSRCQKEVEEVREARRQADSAIEEGRDVAEAVARLKKRRALAQNWSTGSPSFTDRERAALLALDQAEKQAKAGESSLDKEALAAAAKRAGEAKAKLSSLRRDAEARLAEVDTALAAAAADLEEVEQKARRSLRSASRLSPYPRQLGRRVALVEELLADIDRQRDSAGEAEIRALIETLDGASRRLAPLVVGPPKVLISAAEAYLSHEYEAVLEALDGVELRAKREQFHALLLEAAALHGLAVGDGGTDPERQARLTAALAAAAAFDPAPGAPAERFYPPSFRALYDAAIETARASEAAEAAADEAGE